MTEKDFKWAVETAEKKEKTGLLISAICPLSNLRFMKSGSQDLSVENFFKKSIDYP